MVQRRIRVAVALVPAFVALASGALAQGRAGARPASAEPVVVGTGPEYEVKFLDDPLAALPNGAIIPRIVVRGTHGFTMLSRPRTQFVSEMLKSADGF